MAMIQSSNKRQQAKVTDQMLKASNVLLKVLQEENEALERGGVDKSLNILERKIEAINAHNAAQEQFFEFALENKLTKSDSNIQKISDITSQIQQENDKNERLLRINIEISENIITKYKETQVQNIVNQRGYNNQGQANYSKGSKGMMPAMSMNNKI